jgi:uncharacterized protein YegP (UPF0339 family)
VDDVDDVEAQTAYRILSGEPYKSLASFARAVPVISENSRQPE